MTTAQRRLKLPIGIQTFSHIREGGYYYVDKTPYIEKLVNQGKYYFLSRPRRFGKSLLIDTIGSLFEGRKELFQGLHIEHKWNWDINHPVIRLSFGSGVFQTREQLDESIRELLNAEKNRLCITFENTSISGQFRELIRKAHLQSRHPVVVLIDEYDKPILDNIQNSDKARELREGLKNLYSVLKDADADLQFVMLTGVSKFSKVSLFSGLNNLNDITIDAPYSAICGYTDDDIDHTFAPELFDLDRQSIKEWYNGYRWGEENVASVYNPFDVLLLLEKREFDAYWFESATPTFLIDVLKERGIFTPQLDKIQAKAQLLSRFDVDDMTTEALLFQTGYITIKSVQEPIVGYRVYSLGFPNREVESSLNEMLLPCLGVTHNDAQTHQLILLDALQDNDFTQLETHLKSLYAGLPHDWYRNNPIAKYEGHYASVFYSHFAALGLDVTVEDASNHGKVDMTVHFQGRYYLFEFKVVEQIPEGKAIHQLKNKGYAQKYRASGEPIYLIGVEFSSEKRQIVGFDVEAEN